MADVQLTVQVSQPNRVDVTLDSPNIVQVQQAAPTRLEVIQGASLPAGGNVNQVLTKNSNTNFDYVWSTPAAGGGGTGDKISNGAYQLALSANGSMSLPNGYTISTSTGGGVSLMTLPNGGQISTSGSGGVDLIAGPGSGGYAELLSYDSNNAIWVDNNGAYIITNVYGGFKQWIFTSNGELIFPDGATYSDGTLTINSAYAINAATEINSFLNWRTANQSGVQIYNNGVNIFANEPTTIGWKFNSAGELVFPNSTRQNTAWLGYDPNSSSAFNKANSANLVAASAFAKANSANYYAYLVDANVTASFAKANSANYYAYLVDANATAAFAAANVAAQTVPQNAQSGVYALQRSDAGKHIYYTQSTSTILYIPTTANVAFANGTTIMLISRTTSSANVTVTPNSGVTMYLAGNTTSASRNLTTYGMATLIQVAANTWMINGTGVV